MGRVTVEPEAFSLVDFDAGEIVALVESLLDDIGLDRPVRIEVDQTTPLVHSEVTSTDPIVVQVESGALEDARRIRQFSASGARNVLGRHLFQVRDQLDPAFGRPPAAADLSLAQRAAWDAYAAGRLVRLGHRHHDERQRRLYQFRTRHGFRDAADDAFAALWEGVDLTWEDIDRLSSGAMATADV